MIAAIDQARHLIEKRLAELDEERRCLRSALSSLANLEDRTPSGATSSGRPATKRRAARGQRQSEFLAALQQDRGAPVSDIARSMGVRPQQLYPIAQRLSAAGQVAKRKEGYVLIGKASEDGSSHQTS